MFNLQRIIYPVEPSVFAHKYLGRAPLLVLRQSPDYFGALFSMGDLEALIDAERLRPPEIRMTKQGEVFRTETIANTLRAGRYVVSGKAKAVRVWREYNAGATVILQSLHRHWPPLQRLCDMLGNEWLSQAQTNIYRKSPSLPVASAPPCLFLARYTISLLLANAKFVQPLYIAPTNPHQHGSPQSRCSSTPRLYHAKSSGAVL